LLLLDNHRVWEFAYSGFFCCLFFLCGLNHGFVLSPILLPDTGRSTGFAQKLRLLEAITSAAPPSGHLNFTVKFGVSPRPKNTI